MLFRSGGGGRACAVSCLTMRLAQMDDAHVGLVFRVLVAGSVLGSADLWHAPVLLGPQAWLAVLITMAIAAWVLTGRARRASTIAFAIAVFVVVGWLQTVATIHLHHVVWMTTLMAVYRGKFPTRSAAFVLSLVYFFPGVHK